MNGGATIMLKYAGWSLEGIGKFFCRGVETRATSRGNKAQKPCNLNLLCFLLFHSVMMVNL